MALIKVKNASAQSNRISQKKLFCRDMDFKNKPKHMYYHIFFILVDLETGSFNVNSAEMENRGFGLSPAATAFNNMTDQGDDISPVDKVNVFTHYKFRC